MIDGSMPPSPGTPEPRSRGRRVARVAGIVVAVLLLLVVVVLAVLHTPPVRRYALDQITTLLADRQIGFSADSLDYNLFGLSVTLRNLRVRSEAAPDLPDFATASRVHVRIDPLSLLRGRYEVLAGTLDDLDLRFVIAPDGRDNLPRPPDTGEPAEPGDPIDFLVESFEVRNARVRYEDAPQQIDLALRVPELDVEGTRATGRHTVRLPAGEGSLRYEDRVVDVRRLAAIADAGDDDVWIEELIVETPFAQLTASGQVDGFAEPVLDLTAALDVAVDQAAELAGVTEPVGGRARADATIRGPVDALQVAAVLEGSDLSFRTLEGLQLSARGGYDGAAQRADIDDLQITGPVGELAARGSVALAAEAGESRLEATFAALDLATLMRVAELEYLVASRASGELSATMPGLDHTAVRGGGVVRLTPTGAPRRQVVPVAGTVTIDAEGPRLAAQLRQVRALGVAADGSVSLVDLERLGGTVTLTAADLAATIAATETFLGEPAGTLVPVAVAGDAIVRARLAGTTERPAADVTLEAPALSVGLASDLSVEAEAAYTPSAVDLRALDVRWQEAVVRAAGRIGLEGARPLALEATAEGLRIEEVLLALEQPDLPVRGVIGAEAAIGGTIDDPVVAAVVRGEEIVAWEERIEQLLVDVDLQPGDPLRAQIRADQPAEDGGGRLLIDAAYHLDDERFTVEVREGTLQLTRLTLPGDVPVRGLVDLSGRAEGTVEDPRGSFALRVDDLRVQEEDLGSVSADVDLADQQVHARVRLDAFATDAEADIALLEGYPAEFLVRIRDLDLAGLPFTTDLALAGRVRATIEGSGDLADLDTLTGVATLEALEASWNEQPITLDNAPATIRYQSERVVIERLGLRARESTVAIVGELPIDDDAEPGVVEIEARLDLPTLMLYGPPDLDLMADGTAVLSGRIAGSLQALDPTLTLTLDDGAFAAANFQPGLTAVQTRIEVAAGEVRVEELRAALGTAMLDATARVPFDVLPEDLPVRLPRAGGETRVRADLTALDLATLPGAPEGLSGTLALEADLVAPRPDIEALAGEVLFPVLDVAFDGITLRQEGVSRVVLESGTARIDQMVLTGSAGRIVARGTVGLAGERPLDLVAEGVFELAAMAALLDDVRAEGPLSFDIRAGGSVADPVVEGFVLLTDAQLAMADPAIALEDLQLRVDLTTDRAVLSNLAGLLNGGALTGSGSVAFRGGEIADLGLNVRVDGMALDVPLDLRSLIDADLQVTQQDELILVGGEVVIQEAGLTRDLTLDRGLLAGLAGPPSLDLTTERNPLVERMRFDIRVETATPILLDNNLARGEVVADLRVLGTPYEPGMSGRLTIEEGTTVTLNERTYLVERGIITFVEERRIVPVFDLQMTTRVGTYDILLAVTGPPGDTDTRLTSPSNPELPEPDILALLVTGRTLDEVRGEEVARTQVLSYVSGMAGSSIGRGLERATGLSRVRLEPNLIAGEADPGARLTIGQDITDALRLVYSTDLVNGGDEIWVAEYDVTRRFQTRAVRQSDGSYRLDMRHDIRFGGRPEPRRDVTRRRQTVGDVRVEGNSGLPAEEVLRRFGLRSGDEYSFFDVRRGVERVEEWYRSQGLLQSRIRARRSEEGDRIHLTLAIEAGPRVDVRYEGVLPPRRVQDEVVLVWHRGVFDGQRVTDAERALREWLVARDHVAAVLHHRIEELADDRRAVIFEIEAGSRYPNVDVVFEGAEGIPGDELADIVREQRLRPALFTDPGQVTELLERYYREQGYLSARVLPPQREFSGDAARVIVPVQEGPRFRIRAIELTGNVALSSTLLLAESPMQLGDPYLPAVAQRSLERIREQYGVIGFNDAHPSHALAIDRDEGWVDVTIVVDEGRRERVVDIVVEGNEQVRSRLVERQLVVEPGEPLPVAMLGESRRRLYDTRAFALVDIVREEVPQEPPAPDAEPVSLAFANEKPVRLRVTVREVQPFQIRYGGFYDTERGPGGIADFSTHNTFGSARVAGLRTRYDAQLREGRLYLSQPVLADLPLESTVSFFIVQERLPELPESKPLKIDRLGFSVQQEARLRASYVLNYGYRFERTYDRLEPRQHVAPVTSALTRDTRDDVLDATRGQFMSHAFSVSPGFLGADKPFVKYFGQFFTYRPLQPERIERFTGDIIRPRLIYAAGVRLGLSRGFGDGQVPVSERFLGGGSTTLRGFRQYSVGPVDEDGVPGGEATLVINNELRFPLISRFDGVAFLDVGNVFARVADFSFGLRTSGGVGLRIRTPWFLGRVDYGIPFDRREGEARGQVFFSIGQAF
jgi:outer membrane protein insertion porin family